MRVVHAGVGSVGDAWGKCGMAVGAKGWRRETSARPPAGPVFYFQSGHSTELPHVGRRQPEVVGETRRGEPEIVVHTKQIR